MRTFGKHPLGVEPKPLLQPDMPMTSTKLQKRAQKAAGKYPVRTEPPHPPEDVMRSFATLVEEGVSDDVPNTKDYVGKLFLGYAGAATAAQVAFGVGEYADLLQIGIALGLAGMIVGVSYTEAWTKFRAPFLDRYAALDAGRHVFAGLQAVEAGLCVGLWEGSAGVGTLQIAGFTAALLLQTLWLYPALDMRGEAAISHSISDMTHLSEEQQQHLKKIRSKLHNKQIPPATTHVAYALLEAAKVAVLISYAATVYAH